MVQSYERDELRGRFTRFMEVMVKRARLNYLEKMRRQPITVPLDDVPETLLADDTAFPTDVSGDFDFEEERLANAFSQLPLMRQKILIMLFAEELAPKEIARRMNCSVNHVYNQRSLAIKRLRQLLEEGGEGAVTANEFRRLLQSAVAGDHEAVEQILKLYMPLINKNSVIGGRLDEDCRQYILIHIALNIGKFII